MRKIEEIFAIRKITRNFFCTDSFGGNFRFNGLTGVMAYFLRLTVDGKVDDGKVGGIRGGGVSHFTFALAVNFSDVRWCCGVTHSIGCTVITFTRVVII